MIITIIIRIIVIIIIIMMIIIIIVTIYKYIITMKGMLQEDYQNSRTKNGFI